MEKLLMLTLMGWPGGASLVPGKSVFLRPSVMGLQCSCGWRTWGLCLLTRPKTYDDFMLTCVLLLTQGLDVDMLGIYGWKEGRRGGRKEIPKKACKPCLY